MVFEGEDERQTPLSVIGIDPYGDVDLILSDGMNLRVSSKAMSLGSKVFSSMLQPQFAGGAALANTGSCQVGLPDDDPKSMHVICLLLHHHHPESLPYTVDAGFLHTMAVVVDKYACANAVYSWAMQKVSELANASPRPENEDAHLLYACMIFDLPRHFKEITRRMVYSESPWLLTDDLHVSTWGLDKTVRELLPHGLLGKLLKKYRILLEILRSAHRDCLLPRENFEARFSQNLRIDDGRGFGEAYI